MITIKATCGACGEVDLTPPQVRLVVASHPPLSYYAFTCPACRQEVRKPADEHVVTLLLSGGVAPQLWDVPAEALETRSGNPLDYDDLLDFALGLAREDRLAALATGSAVPGR